MAVDKLVDSTQLNGDLTSVANAIRTKGGTSAQLAFPADFVSAIAAIPSGSGENVETGSFIATTSDSITIPVTSMHKILFIWMENYDPYEDLSSAPYGNNKVLNRVVLSPDLMNVCGYLDGAIAIVTTGSDGKSFRNYFEIGSATSNTISFTSSSITITTMRAGGSNRQWVDGATYYWRAV